MSLFAIWLACGEPAPAPPATGEARDATEADTVDSPYLDAPDTVERVAARHLLLPWAGSRGAPLGTSRSRDDAFREIEELRARMLAGEDFALLAKEHSTDGTRMRGGFLGSFERGSMASSFEDAVWRLPIGGLSLPVETEYGVHLILREPLEEVRLRHVLVQHQDAPGIAPDSPAASRPREEAKRVIDAARVAIIDDERPFAEVAAEVGDTATSRRGAELGWFFRAELGQHFDDALDGLEPGDVSEVIETPLGFHLVERVE